MLARDSKEYAATLREIIAEFEKALGPGFPIYGLRSFAVQGIIARMLRTCKQCDMSNRTHKTCRGVLYVTEMRAIIGAAHTGRCMLWQPS